MGKPAELLWLDDPDTVRARVEAARRGGQTVGLVPTMGNLHAGHQSLMIRAREENDLVVVTLFVNPIQFVAGEDFDHYPRTPEHDRRICAEAGVGLIFAPRTETMYPPDSRTRVQVVGLEEPLCGHHRPGHFIGVATVVTKLFNIVPADVAYVGAKDYQQAKLIERLTADLNFPIKIRVCPTVREPDGLAMSSRNQYLSPTERREATVLRRALDLAEELVGKGDRSVAAIRHRMVELITSQSSGQVDYVEILDATTLKEIADIASPALAAVAVRFGKARLIDNTVLTLGSR